MPRATQSVSSNTAGENAVNRILVRVLSQLQEAVFSGVFAHLLLKIKLNTRNTFCGTWYLPHSHVHNERTVFL